MSFEAPRTSVMNRCLPYIILLLVVIFIAGCEASTDGGREQARYDDPLWQLDSRLYLQRFMMDTHVRVSCIFDSVFARMEDGRRRANLGRSDEIEEMAATSAKECEFARRAFEFVSPSFEEIVSTRVKEGYYFFDAAIPRSEGDLSLWRVGVFGNIATCKNLRALAVSYDYLTRSCREWPPRSLVSSDSIDTY